MDTSSSFLFKFAIPLALGLVLRSATLLHPYSGKASPPMYGDYEAQRHWMEVTVNLDFSDWYVNTSSNDLLYWGLDYPPLTAYHSYLLGRIARFLHPEWIELFKSRGYESDAHKSFMRLSVLISDCLTYMLAAIFYCDITVQLIKNGAKLSGISVAFLMLSFPGLIVIDHGHFQYNCVSLGLFLISLILFSKDCDIFGSVAFCLAVSYKQMELYHALPIFFYLLSKSFSSTFLSGVKRVTILGLTVCATFAVVLLPFLTLEQLNHVAMRMFPVNRGLYEDKVANFWCISSIFIKWRQLFTTDFLVYCCGVATIVSSLPACYKIFKKPTFPRLILSEVIVSLAFFLFSYHVHEKSILLVCVPVLCLLVLYPLSATYFLIIATLSMWQLFVKDGLCQCGLGLVVVYYVVSSLCLAIDATGKSRVSLVHFFPLSLSLLGYVGIFALPLVAQPPERYPFLFPLILNTYSFVHFVGFFFFWYWQLFSSETL
nr:dolichyl pyrophosphate Man9GlcNAc2 [Hymenolepis microstoma]